MPISRGVTRKFARSLSRAFVRSAKNNIVPFFLELFPSATAAYSLRQLHPDAIFAIRVRRSSDDQEMDIGFTSTGELDKSGLLTFVGSGDGFVVIWYDQSGNNNHASQATANSQPMIVNAGAVIKENGKPAIEFDGVDDTLLKNPFFPSDNLSIIMVMNPLTSATSFENFLSVSQAVAATNDFEIRREASNNKLKYLFNKTNNGVSFLSFGNLVLNANQILLTIIDNLSVGNSTGYVNANQKGNLSFPPDTRSGTEDILRIGSRGSGLFASMKIQEINLYFSDQSANRSDMNMDINNHYLIY